MNDFNADLNDALKYAVDERAAFEKAIDDNPLDATTHLVYADWLQENGEEDEAAFRRAMGEWVGSGPQLKNKSAADYGIDVWSPRRYPLWAEGIKVPYHYPPHLPHLALLGWSTYRGMESAFRKVFLAGRKS